VHLPAGEAALVDVAAQVGVDAREAAGVDA
jgi:hypothetical protein